MRSFIKPRYSQLVVEASGDAVARGFTLDARVMPVLGLVGEDPGHSLWQGHGWTRETLR